MQRSGICRASLGAYDDRELGLNLLKEVRTTLARLCAAPDASRSVGTNSSCAKNCLRLSAVAQMITFRKYHRICPPARAGRAVFSSHAARNVGTHDARGLMYAIYLLIIM